MNEARLRTLTITNFRSIRDSVPIDLDAPVVLLHGQNGAGKTTVMSALELALTGRIAGLDDADRRHLVHHGAKTAVVEISTSIGSAKVSTDGGKSDGGGLLNASDARFFGERCYLAQRRLGTLLEIYARAQPDSDSPLTRFVKDLLGLDELDALIDGLDPVRDTRLVKSLVPEYADTTKSINRQRGNLAVLRAQIQAVAEDAANARDQLGESLDSLGAPATVDAAGDTSATTKWLITSDEETELEPLESASRDIQRARSRYDKLAKERRVSGVRSASRDASAARNAADAWWKSSGSKLEEVLDEIRKDIPTIATVIGSDPAYAHQEAVERVDAEVERITATLAADERAANEMKGLDRTIRTSQRRIDKIDREIAASSIASASRDLAGVLAALVPHLHGEDCPVCGRDYREIGGQSLASHLAKEVSKLSAQAERMQELAAARLEAITATGTATEERKVCGAVRLDSDTRDTFGVRLSRLTRYRGRLTRLRPGAQDGAAIVTRATEAERRRTIAERSDRVIGELVSSLEALCGLVGLRAPARNETPDKTIARLEAHVAPKIKQIKIRQGTREIAHEQLGDLARLTGRQKSLKAEIEECEIGLAATAGAVKVLEKRRNTLRKLRKDSQERRTQIIRQVFNSSLNRMWRDLFVRLAPSELFVPEFLVPDTGARTVTANLITHHRDGSSGGSPAAMLSAGNLNTAALTLFLALHLTAKATLPWLFLDDPVQSMDEVHVAQFAAVLRTLTRQHGRRIVIAVHEPALFDYLALELSPARPGDALITIEMTRGQDGVSTLTPSTRKYKVDPVLAAA